MPRQAPTDFTFPTARGRTNKYNWHQYTDGNAWIFESGVDYDPAKVSVKSLRTQAHVYAGKHGYVCRTTVDTSNGDLYIKFTPKQNITGEAA